MPTRADKQENQNPEAKMRPAQSINVGEFSVAIPKSSPEQLSDPELEQIIELITKLQESNFTHSTLPKNIREGKESIADPENLKKALTPSGKYLAENLTDFTKDQIGYISREALQNKAPINIQVDLPSFSISDAQDDTPPSPNFFDYLFLKQVKDYLQILNKYPHGVNLTFNFDDNGESWIFEEVLDAEKISQTQSTQVGTLSKVIKKLFPDEDFPEFNIRVNSEGESKTEDLNRALEFYRKLEKIILEKSAIAFKKMNEKDNREWSWASLWSLIRDPDGFGHSMFYDFTDSFIKDNLSELDLISKDYEIFRPTTRQIWLIGAQIRSLIKKEYYENKPESEVPHSGWIQEENIQELTRRFIARELLLNHQAKLKPKIIHLAPGHAHTHKQFYRRRTIALKPSSANKFGGTNDGSSKFAKPSISFYEDEASIAQPIGTENIKKATILTVEINGVKFNLPIMHY